MVCKVSSASNILGLREKTGVSIIGWTKYWAVCLKFYYII